jgi:hypothetical protein
MNFNPLGNLMDEQDPSQNPAAAQQQQPQQSGHKEFLKGLLGNFLYSLGHGLQASAMAPPSGAAGAGMGAAIVAPFNKQMEDRQMMLREQIAAQEAARAKLYEAQAAQLPEKLEFEKAKTGQQQSQFEAREGRIMDLFAKSQETQKELAKQNAELRQKAMEFQAMLESFRQNSINERQDKSLNKPVVPLPPEVEAQKVRIAKASGGSGRNSDIALTPEGLAAAATQYANTGQMPALGMGNATARAQIINEAAKMYPKLNPAANAAEYSANKNSLSATQKMRDAVVSFENTALKNWDQFERTVKPIVDSGSPILNIPLRAINQKGLGSPELLAFNAARQVAINEIAKVVSNPTMAGQLSDTARKEVEAFVPENATIAQIFAVGKILKTDMANRKQSLDDIIADQKGRLGIVGRGAASTQTSVVKIRDPKTGRTGKYNGTADEAKAAGYEVIP